MSTSISHRDKFQKLISRRPSKSGRGSRELSDAEGWSAGA